MFRSANRRLPRWVEPCRSSVYEKADRIPLGPNRTLQVVRVRDDDADQAPVLVVQDLALKSV